MSESESKGVKGMGSAQRRRTQCIDRERLCNLTFIDLLGFRECFNLDMNMPLPLLRAFCTQLQRMLKVSKPQGNGAQSTVISMHL